MLKNNLLIAWRSLTKNKVYSIINSLGLAVGISAFLLISLYVRHEFGYEAHLDNKDNIYRIQLNRYDKGELSTQWAAGCAGIGPALLADFPEVEAYVKLHGENAIIQFDDEIFKEERTYYATSAFFEMFSFKLLQGVDSLVLKDPYTAVLSESTAKRFFGDEDPVGKTIKVNGRTEYGITGVYEDIPEQSHMEADILYSFETYVNLTNERARDAWDWDGFYTYIELKAGTDAKEFETKLPEYVQTKWGEAMAQYDTNMEFLLQPIDNIHLYSDLMYEFKANGDGKATYFLLIIAVFILFIAWVNYVNLSTAKSMERAREVGIRKVMGSAKAQLTRQFLVESFVLNLIGIVLALIIVVAVLPTFNQLSGITIRLSVADELLWMTIAALFVIGGFVSGIYPALVLSGFKPASVLKGKLAGSAGGSSLRKGLVVFQFIASLVLMVGTAAVFEQLRFMQNQELGVNIEQTMIVKGPNVTDSLYNDKFNAFKHAVNGLAPVKSVTSSTSVPGRLPGWNAGGIRLLEQQDTDAKQYRIIGVDGDFVEAYNLEMAAGRMFDKERTNERSVVLFNESAVVHLGLSINDVLEREIYFWGDTFKIVGVLKDYHQESLKKSFEPLIFRYYPSVTGFYSVKVQTGNLPETIDNIEQEWDLAFAGNPFEYFFLDDYFNEQYKAEMRFGKVFGLFAGLAIFIACLGLFGLASYMTKYRTKEIGIRKALGASVSNIWLLLSRDFSSLVIVATVLAVPISWYIIHLWLQDFAYRITISWWLFALPALMLMFIALFSVSFQTTKSALSNPVDALRDE